MEFAQPNSMPCWCMCKHIATCFAFICSHSSQRLRLCRCVLMSPEQMLCNAMPIHTQLHGLVRVQLAAELCRR